MFRLFLFGLASVLPFIAAADGSLLVRLGLNEGSGSIATDSSGLGNDGDLVGGPAYQNDTTDGSAYALQFDGMDDRIDLNPLDVVGNAITLAVWFKADSFPGNNRDPFFVSKTSGNALSNYIFSLGTIRAGNGTRLRARVRVAGATTNLRADAGTELETDQWYHAAAVYDGTEFRLFLDGVEVGSASVSGDIDQDPGLEVTVGSRTGGGNEFDGLLDDVRIYADALSEQALQSILAGNAVPIAQNDSYTAVEDTVLSVASTAGLLQNDNDPDGDDLNAELVTDATHGSIALSTDGSFTYTPEADYFGSDSFFYQVSDGTGVSNGAMVSISVTATNDAPIANIDEYQIAINQILTVEAAGVLSNDTDTEGDLLTATLGTTTVSNGILVLNEVGSFTYTPDADFTGSDQFSYVAVDSGNAVSAETEVTISVANPPNATDDSFTLAEDAAFSVIKPGVLTNDIDNTGPEDLLTELASDVSSGALTLNPDGSFDYMGDPDFFGVDSFTYRAVDSVTGVSDTAQVTLQVTSVNDAPVAIADDFVTEQEVGVNGDVLANDSDVDGDTLTASLVSSVSNGLLDFQSDGTFSYIPDILFTGEDSFVYVAEDGEFSSAPTQTTVVVEAAVGADPDLLVELDFDDGAEPATDTSGNGNDGILSGPVYRAETGNGSAQSLEFDGINDSVDLGTLDVTGSGLTLAAWFKADSFPSNARDPRLISKTSGIAANDHIFMLSTIAAGNETRLRARIRIDGSTFTLRGPAGSHLVTDQWYHAATTYDGTNLKLYLDGVEIGSTVLGGPVDQDPTVNVAIGSNPGGGDVFDGLIDDIRILQRPLSVAEIQDLLVGNQSPVAIGETYTLSEDSTLATDETEGVLINDFDPENTALSAILIADVQYGALVLDADGSFSYTPNPNFAGEDAFTYQVSDGLRLSEIVSTTLVVENSNDLPVAVADQYQLVPGDTLIVGLPGILENDSDADSDPLLVAAGTTTVAHGELILATDGSFSYTPEATHPGEDTFSYTVSDPLGGISEEAEVTLIVALPPLTVADEYTLSEDNPLQIGAPGVLGNDTDTTDPNNLLAILAIEPTSGTVSLESDGGFTYTPDADFFGVDSFTYRATDAVTGAASTDNVVINVTAVQDSPIAQTDEFSTESDVSVQGDVLLNDGDVDGDELIAILDQTVNHGFLNLNPNGTFSYQPNSGFVGLDSFTYRASDGFFQSDPVQVNINVVPNSSMDPDMLVFYQFDNGQSPATDSSIYGNDGILSGQSYTSETGNGSVSALEFDGIDDTIDMGPIDVAGTGITLAAWFKADSFPGSARDPRIISKSTGTAVNDHIFLLGLVKGGNETRLRARIRINGNTFTLRGNPGTGVSTGVWYHAAAIYNGAIFQLFLNGVEVASMPLTGLIDQDDTVNVATGSQTGGGRHFDGLLDDILILQRAATLAEIQEMVVGNSAPMALGDSYNATEDDTLDVDDTNGLLANDQDPDGDALSAILVSAPTNGTISLGSDGAFTYTPDQDYSGPDGFSYQADDGGLQSEPVDVSIVVAALNDAPVALADSFNGGPLGELTIIAPGVLGNDFDVDLDPLLALAGTVSPEHGTLTLDPDGSFVYQPNENHPGVDMFTYFAVDSSGIESLEVEVQITIVEPPAVVNDSYSLNEDTDLTVQQPGVLANDTDSEPPENLQVVVSVLPQHGELLLQTDGGFTYTPNDDFSGTDAFSYVATDQLNAGSAEGSVSIQINAVPDNPVAVQDTFITEFGQVLNDNVLTNDSDADEDLLTAVEVDSPQSGFLTLGADGEFSYSPNTGFSGTDTFTYIASDGFLESEETLVSIEVLDEPNTDPDLLVHLSFDDGLDPATDSSGFENHGFLSGAMYTNNSGDGSALSMGFNGTSDQVSLGTIDVVGSGLSIAAWVKADSFPGSSRDARIVSKALDSGSNAHFFMLSTIAVGNETRLRGRIRLNGTTYTLRADAGYNMVEGEWYHVAATFDGTSFRLYLNGEEVGIAILAGVLDQDNTVGVAVGSQPAGDKVWHGQIDDVRILQRALSKSEIENLAVGNLPPITLGDEYSVDEDTALSVNSQSSVLLNDLDEANLQLTAILVATTVNGELTLHEDGTFEYLPDIDYSGIDFFTYQAFDGISLSNEATVVISVDPVNDAPVAVIDSYQVTPDQQLDLPAPGLLTNDTDPEGDSLVVVSGGTSTSHGLLVLNSDGSLTYSPDNNFMGQDSFSYFARDTSGAESAETFVEFVVALPPLANDDTYTVQEDSSIEIGIAGVLGNDTDQTPPVDLEAYLVSGAASGTVVLNLEGDFVYTPMPDFSGADSFVYSAIDPITGGAANATVNLTVTGSPDTPISEEDSYVTAFDTELSGNVLFNDSDPDGDLLEAVLVQDVTSGTLNLQSDGTFAYLPNAGFVGDDSFTYRASDSVLTSSETMVNIEVEAFTPPDPDALVHIPFDDGLFPATDVSGFDNHGVIAGATYIGDSGDDSGSAMGFDGIDDRVDLGGLDVSGSEISLAAWIKAESFPGDSNDPSIISKASSPASADHLFALSTVAAGNEIRLRLRIRLAGSSYTVRANPGTNIETGRWYHAAATYDGTTAKLYLDGVEVKSQTLSGTVDQDPAVGVSIGGNPGGGHEFDGLIDDVWILQRALDSNEVSFLAGDTAPDADFNVSPQFGDVPLLVSFDATPTSAFDESDLVFNWDFGDGNFGSGEMIDHIYEDLGNFNATLTVTNSSGEQDTASKIIRATSPGNSLQIVSWTQLSTSAGDIPAPSGTSIDQTAGMTFDISGDGVSDIVIAGRGGFLGPSIEWWESMGGTWTRHTIEPDLLPLQVGAAYYDIDSDGDMDFILGEDMNGSRLYWWENPHPDFSSRWTRRVIADIPGARYHDQIFGDFDGDGAGELAFWNNDSRDVYLADIPADPTIEPWPVNIIFTASANSEGLAAGDIDQDGNTDLVASGFWFKYDEQTGYVPQTIDADKNLVRVEVGQLIPGGRPEVVFDSAEVSDRLTMYQWDGANWVGSELLDEDIERGHSLNIGDVNNDGFLDVMSGEMYLGGNTTPELRIFYGDGTGSFFPQLVSVGNPDHESKLADLDGDGDLDILSKPFRQGAPGFSIWINDLGTVALEWERNVLDANVPYRTIFVEHGDLDGDGFEDVTTGGWWWRNPGQANGNWQRNTIGSPLNQIASLYDFDADGDLDILGSQGIGSASNSTLSWAENDGSGNFTIHNNIEQAAGDFLQGVSIARFNGTDLEIALSWQNCVSGLQMLTVPAAANVTTEDWSWRTLDTACGGESLDNADIDFDGDLDLLTGYTWYRNDGQDQYTRFDLTGDTPGQPDRNILVDIDNDGDLDALIGFGHDPTKAISWFEQGDDPTTLWNEHPIGNFEVGLAQSVDVADLDGDGVKEVVVGEHQFTNPPGLLLQIYKLQNDGTWIPEVVYSGDEHHDGAQLFDADNDGDLDIVSIGWAHRRLLMYENQTVPIDGPYQNPTTPGSLLATVLSDAGVTLSWTAALDDIEVVSYQIFRDSVLIATVTSLSYMDTTATSLNHTYEVVAVDADGNQSEAASIDVNLVSSSEGGWWDLNWPYRVLLGVSSGGFDRMHQVVELDVDFDQLIVAGGGNAAFEPETLRCHEVDADGSIIDPDIHCQASNGKLILLADGLFPAESVRYFHVYMDIVDGAGVPSANTSLVTLTDNIVDEGQSSFLIETQNATYYYHKQGGGFSSLLDIDGLDWIGYDDDIGGAFGQNRGIPNLVRPDDGGHFHPGALTSISSFSANGPVKVTFDSIALNGQWQTSWSIYPYYATLTVNQVPGPYWFLYEGVPGGFLDSTDSSVRSGGISTLLPATDLWVGDLEPEEWAYVSASEVTRSIYVLHHENDQIVDSYRSATPAGGMTVLGFGRENAEASLLEVPQHFTFGFVDSHEFESVKDSIQSRIQPFSIELSDVVTIP